MLALHLAQEMSGAVSSMTAGVRDAGLAGVLRAEVAKPVRGMKPSLAHSPSWVCRLRGVI
jgi:hypothetical protein